MHIAIYKGMATEWLTGRVVAGMLFNSPKKASNGSHHIVIRDSSETKSSVLGRL